MYYYITSLKVLMNFWFDGQLSENSVALLYYFIYFFDEKNNN